MELLDVVLISLSAASVLAGSLHLYRTHESIEQRLNSLFDRLCTLENVPKSDPIIAPIAVEPPAASAVSAPKKRVPRAKKA